MAASLGFVWHYHRFPAIINLDVYRRVLFEVMHNRIPEIDLVIGDVFLRDIHQQVSIRHYLASGSLW
jgi:hypothetical protein